MIAAFVIRDLFETREYSDPSRLATGEFEALPSASVNAVILPIAEDAIEEAARAKTGLDAGMPVSEAGAAKL